MISSGKDLFGFVFKYSSSLPVSVSFFEIFWVHCASQFAEKAYFSLYLVWNYPENVKMETNSTYIQKQNVV